MPSSASTLSYATVVPRESSGAKGVKPPLDGQFDRGAVPNERAAMTS